MTGDGFAILIKFQTIFFFTAIVRRKHGLLSMNTWWPIREKRGQSIDKKSIHEKSVDATEFPRCGWASLRETKKINSVAYDKTIKQDLTKKETDNSRCRACKNSHESFCYKQMLCYLSRSTRVGQCREIKIIHWKICIKLKL